MKHLKWYLTILLAVLLIGGIEPIQGSEITGAPDIIEESEDYTIEQESLSLFAYIENHSMYAGETQTIRIETDFPMEQLVYESADTSIATVSPNGIITAVSGGSTGSAYTTITISRINPTNGWSSCSYTLVLYVTNTIELDKTTYTIYLGQKNAIYQLAATTNPQGVVTWTSSNNRVATVDANGIITPKKKGTVTITATANGVSAYCEVTVTKPFLKLPSQATIYLKNPQKLDFQIGPNATIKWKSSNTKIAKVSAKGVITGLKKGKITITAKAHGVTKKCKVTIAAPEISIYGYDSASSWDSKNPYTALYVGSTTQLTAYASPSVKVTWKSSNSKIVKVDKDGVITGVKPGTAKITASIPGAKASWKVKIIKNKYTLNFTTRTLMLGNKANLYIEGAEDEYASFRAMDSGNSYFGYFSNYVDFSLNGTNCAIEAQAVGSTVIEARLHSYSSEEQCYVVWSKTCTVRVVDSGISELSFSLAKGAKKTCLL